MLYLYEIIFNYIYDANIIIIFIFAIKKHGQKMENE